ncbi:MAG: helix-turn-helix domain-containing protein [Candidatus Aminicenantes bacterium]|nr:MAG: helix-turn-helix domain-containing protein [Candidatus Aminicenantes bacterium]
MDEKNLNRYFEILELRPGASFSEIKSAYFHLRKLYSSESPVLSAMMDDISETRQEQLLTQIEEAYRELKEHYSAKKTEKEKITRDRVMRNNIPEFEVFSGNALKLTREVLGVRLEEIALATGIPMTHLKNIERERFDLLPPDGYIRIYVTRYAEYLSLDPNRVTQDYMKAVYKKKPHTDRHRF